MKIQLPSLKSYSMGLLVLTLIAIASSVALPTFGIENHGVLLAVMAGLVIGHFVGTTVQAKPALRTATVSNSRQSVKTIYVGNLSFNTSKHDLYNLFKQYGKVHSSRIMFDRITRKSRGFGFVEMSSDAADAAIEDLNGSMFSGRDLRVNEANNQAPYMRR
ncbi:RNA recognition motif domain-containing protein [Kaarinaea lacus]